MEFCWAWLACGISEVADVQVQHGAGGESSAALTWLCSRGGVVLTSTGDIVGQWKEYFKDLLNLTDTPSVEKAESSDKGKTRPSLGT